MTSEYHRGLRGRWALALVYTVVLTVGLGVFIVVRSHSHRPDLMTLDPDGTMRLGPVPLRNTNVRDAALTVVGHLNNGTISFSSTGAVTISNIAGTLQEMKRVGVSNIIIRSGNISNDQRASPSDLR